MLKRKNKFLKDSKHVKYQRFSQNWDFWDQVDWWESKDLFPAI
jgi:hypothetical protein